MTIVIVFVTISCLLVSIIADEMRPWIEKVRNKIKETKYKGFDKLIFALSLIFFGEDKDENEDENE